MAEEIQYKAWTVNKGKFMNTKKKFGKYNIESWNMKIVGCQAAELKSWKKTG